MKKLNEIAKGFVDTIPLGIGVSIYGIVYGVLCGNAGLSAFETLAMSAFVFAGASQVAIVQMIALGSTPLSIILTVIVINLRHYLLAASISPYLKHEPKWLKMINGFFMTDESYAATYNYFNKSKPNSMYFLGSGINIYLFWGAAGLIGYMFGNIIPQSLSYILDFAFVAAFIGIVVPMIKDSPTLATVLTSVAIAVPGSILIPGKWYIIIAGIGASFVGYLVSLGAEERNNPEKIKGSESKEVVGGG